MTSETTIDCFDFMIGLKYYLIRSTANMPLYSDMQLNCYIIDKIKLYIHITNKIFFIR